MHILLTNDDGPPNPNASPYIESFVRILRSPPFNHTVSVVVPSQQRSWIGKAHLLPPSFYAGPGQQKSKNEDISDEITPTYYDPSTGKVLDTLPAVDASKEASSRGRDYWILVPGTPATCAQLGIFHHHHLFPGSRASVNPESAFDSSKSPIDLVVSGPNLGRNTSAAFALSSGTIGGALEAAVCGLKAVALSFAFYTKKESQETIDEACMLSARIIEKLWQEWGATANAVESQPASMKQDADSADLYTINVPLIPGVSETPIHWTWMLNNRWSAGSLYKVIGANHAVQPDQSQSSAGADDAQSSRPLSFKWSPTFGDIWKTVESSAPGNDGRTIMNKHTSVTPLKANFEGVFGRGSFQGEFKL